MAKAEIFAGKCGFTTVVEAIQTDNEHINVTVTSACKSCQKLGAALSEMEVDPLREISHRGEGSLILQMAQQYLSHPACPVPAGIIKAVEIAAGFALPADASIKLSA
ncbi:MAG: hypothetical protein RMN25_00895 [Anaerolineae bacterium]|nr:hypothetical protein [Thermoflexales bacterium]MDW8406313.1 hypothetical protein [Anaerolineae bacterium]